MSESPQDRHSQDMNEPGRTGKAKHDDPHSEMPNRAQDTTAAQDRQQPRVLRHRIDPKLLELLVCPLTKASLDFNAATGELISRQARLAYPIRDGIPIMLPDEARPLADDE